MNYVKYSLDLTTQLNSNLVLKGLVLYSRSRSRKAQSLPNKILPLVLPIKHILILELKRG